MDIYQEYEGKCCTPDQAVQVVKDGDWVDYGMSCAYPMALDKALARRHGDLKDIKVRNAISCHTVAILEADPDNETFTYLQQKIFIHPFILYCLTFLQSNCIFFAISNT